MASLLVSLAALFVSVPIAVLAIECFAAIFMRRAPKEPELVKRPGVCVLIPAHDEAKCIEAAIASVRPQLVGRDRILVVAHNCKDATASKARLAGAEVLEVEDDGQGGKPDALKAGLRALDDNPPAVCCVIDADCRAESGSIEALAYAAFGHDAPVQGVYLFRATDEVELSSISSLALLVKNAVRPLGLHRLGMPCLLNGAGSAYPFRLLRHAPHGEGSIAEDYQLSIDLALQGHATRFCPRAEVRSTLPGSNRSAFKQRKRWEHGHLRLFLTAAPRLFVRGILRQSTDLVGLALDLCVPPLSFLALWWAATTALAGAHLMLGGPATALWVSGVSGSLLLTTIIASVWKFAGAKPALGLLWLVPRYVLWKIPLYLAYLFRRETKWKKTERHG